MELYKIIKLPKGGGRYRTIYAPSSAYKAELRAIVRDTLNRAQIKADAHGVSFAFTPKRNIVQAAKQHIAHAYTLSFDLESFFDSVTKQHLTGKVSKEILEKCLIDGITKQGLPTSPALANIAFAKTDEAILSALRKRGVQAIYTRYADDLTFSFDDLEAKEKITQIVKECVTRAGFKINARKTEFQTAKGGRRIICGIAVGDTDVQATREQKRRLRAMLHKKNIAAAAGLSAWCAMQEPKKSEKVLKSSDELIQFNRNFDMGIRKNLIIKEKETVQLGNSCVISGDPVQIAGMSIFTNGWTSCMGEKGQYRKGVSVWLQCKNTRIAYLGNGRTLTKGGVERPQMAARCLVHTLEDGGGLVYDRIYPSDTQGAVLIEELEKIGAISIKHAKIGSKVGYILGLGKRPYLDSLKSENVTLKGGKKVIRLYI